MDTNNIMPFAFMEGESPKDKSQNIIKVIGVGGGGSNAVKNMYKQGVHNVQFAICNTDSQALARADIPVKIQLGKAGLGVGGKPEKGREAAEYSIDAIRTLFEDDTQMVFITCGMGGGTGTGDKGCPLRTGGAGPPGPWISDETDFTDRHRRHHCLRCDKRRSCAGTDHGAAAGAYPCYFRNLRGGLRSAFKPGLHQHDP